MSYADLEARWEREEAIQTALENHHTGRLRELAKLEAEEGNLEVADDLIKAAKRMEEGEWAFDGAGDNDL